MEAIRNAIFQYIGENYYFKQGQKYYEEQMQYEIELRENITKIKG
jgi:hypothetical protein